MRFSGPKTSIIRTPTTSLKTSIKTITNLSDTNCLEIHGASLGCSSAANQERSAQDATESFYKSYLSVFGSDETRPYPADELRKYVSADTIARINAIQEISEQELIESDYFTYTQDYSREWIPALRVENARPFLNGEVVHVIEGAGNGRS
ncbi:DUF3828 domain-containing protein [Enterobacter roggenkampii]|uniref:DUF3828 domain-containing protein n=1 Tax=Enterobacter roggenkampii TaxID=1812935 RepID=UPI0030F3CEE4